MYDAEMRDYGVIHVLPKERIAVKRVESDSIRSKAVSWGSRKVGFIPVVFTALVDLIATFSVLLHRYVAQLMDMSQRFWCV